MGTLGAKKNVSVNMRAIQWLLSFSDGKNSIETISKKSGINLKILKDYAILCCKNKLLTRLVQL